MNQTLETGWKLGVNHSMADGIITPDEEARLREFRDQLALGTETADPGAMGVPFAYGVCLGEESTLFRLRRGFEGF